MKILVINTGSSSIKYQLFQMDDQSVLASGLIEKIGETTSKHTYKTHAGKKIFDDPVTSHEEGLKQVVNLITDNSVGVIVEKSEIKAIGHRVVHGGETFQKPCIIDEAVLNAVRKNISLAPLHNPANITGIEVAQKIFPAATQVGVFDTAFHHTMPPKAFHYAVPLELYREYKIRRYGFHGTSHHYVALQAAKELGKSLSESNLITVHIGNGASITAIKNGKSIDTSMGLTPLEGLIMGTRSGDIDPAIPYFLTTQSDKDINDINNLLNKESGMKGICGMNDFRDIRTARNQGDQNAQLAFEMYVYRIKKYIGAYCFALGQVDAIIFTAGVGENADDVRWEVCLGLENFGIKIDKSKNEGGFSVTTAIQQGDSKVKLLVIPTNEELMIAIETKKLL